MLENNTDRLFWTISAIIVASLMLIIGIKIFPTSMAMIGNPMPSVINQADNVSDASNPDKLDYDNYLNNTSILKQILAKQTQQLNTYKDGLTNTVNKLADYDNRILTLKSNPTNANNTAAIKDLTGKIDDAKQQVANYQNQVNNLNTQLQQLKNIQDNHAKSISDDQNMLQQLQQQINNTQSSSDYTNNQLGTTKNMLDSLKNTAFTFRGEWDKDYWDWDPRDDGIYTINYQAVNETYNSENLPKGFSGWGIMFLYHGWGSKYEGDRYGIIYDNLGHVFTNHLFVGAAKFSGWVQIDGHGV